MLCTAQANLSYELCRCTSCHRQQPLIKLYTAHAQGFGHTLYVESSVGNIVVDILRSVVDELLVERCYLDVFQLWLELILLFVGHCIVPLQQIMNPHIEHLEVERLSDVVVGAIGETLYLMFLSQSGCEHDERDVGRTLVALYRFTELITVHHRHHNVAYYKVGLMLGYSVESLTAVFSSQDIEMLAEFIGEEVEEVGAVVDDEHCLLFLSVLLVALNTLVIIAFLLLVINGAVSLVIRRMGGRA